MPNVLICPYLLRNQAGNFRTILESAGFQTTDPVGDFALTREELKAYLPETDAMLAGGERMTPDLLDLAPRLKVIARTGVGYDLIDVPAATSRGIAVTITPGTNHGSVAEQALALLFALARRIVPYNQAIHAGGWDRRLVEPIRGKTIGLIGLGRIGRAVATRARAFEMNVIAHDTVADDSFDLKHSIARVSLPELLSQADVVSLHVPLTSATRGMVDRDFLGRMKSGAYLINTSRGGLIVEADLAESLKTGQLAGAGLDVMNHEPPEQGNPLLGLPNLLLSPHIAGTDQQSMSDMAELAARTILRLTRGDWPEECVVNGELKESWRW